MYSLTHMRALSLTLSLSLTHTAGCDDDAAHGREWSEVYSLTHITLSHISALSSSLFLTHTPVCDSDAAHGGRRIVFTSAPRSAIVSRNRSPEHRQTDTDRPRMPARQQYLPQRCETKKPQCLPKEPYCVSKEFYYVTEKIFLCYWRPQCQYENPGTPFAELKVCRNNLKILCHLICNWCYQKSRIAHYKGAIYTSSTSICTPRIFAT